MEEKYIQEKEGERYLQEKEKSGYKLVRSDSKAKWYRIILLCLLVVFVTLVVMLVVRSFNKVSEEEHSLQFTELSSIIETLNEQAFKASTIEELQNIQVALDFLSGKQYDEADRMNEHEAFFIKMAEEKLLSTIEGKKVLFKSVEDSGEKNIEDSVAINDVLIAENEVDKGENEANQVNHVKSEEDITGKKTEIEKEQPDNVYAEIKVSSRPVCSFCFKKYSVKLENCAENNIAKKNLADRMTSNDREIHILAYYYEDYEEDDNECNKEMSEQRACAVKKIVEDQIKKARLNPEDFVITKDVYEADLDLLLDNIEYSDLKDKDAIVSFIKNGGVSIGQGFRNMMIMDPDFERVVRKRMRCVDVYFK